jgi:hypothetical protein
MFSFGYTSSGSQLSIREPVRTLSADSLAYERSEANCEVFVTMVGKYLIASLPPGDNPIAVNKYYCCYYNYLCLSQR